MFVLPLLIFVSFLLFSISLALLNLEKPYVEDKDAIMGLKNITLFELMLLSIMVGRTFAVIDTQEQVPTHENQQTLGNIGSLIEPSSSAKILSESAVPGKSSRYIIRFARAPSSMIRFSRSPSSQIRFGRSQPFVRFGRSNELNNDYHPRALNYFTDTAGNGAGPTEKLIRFAKNGADEYYDDGIQIEPRSGGDSGFIRFGRSQAFVSTPHKSDALRTINWRNFLRLGRNTNANIRFAGKRDGGSTGISTGNSGTNHHNAIQIEALLEKMAQQKQQVHTSNPVDMPNERNMGNDDDPTPFDGNDTNTDQYQSVYSNGNDLEQR